jgi:hypothetical protein
MRRYRESVLSRFMMDGQSCNLDYDEMIFELKLWKGEGE